VLVESDLCQLTFKAVTYPELLDFEKGQKKLWGGTNISIKQRNNAIIMREISFLNSKV